MEIHKTICDNCEKGITDRYNLLILVSIIKSKYPLGIDEKVYNHFCSIPCIISWASQDFS